MRDGWAENPAKVFTTTREYHDTRLLLNVIEHDCVRAQSDVPDSQTTARDDTTFWSIDTEVLRRIIVILVALQYNPGRARVQEPE